MPWPAGQKIDASTSEVCGRSWLCEWEPLSPKVTTISASYITSKLFFHGANENPIIKCFITVDIKFSALDVFLDPASCGVVVVSISPQSKIRGPESPVFPSPPVLRTRGQLCGTEISSAQTWTVTQGAPQSPGSPQPHANQGPERRKQPVFDAFEALPTGLLPAKRSRRDMAVSDF